VGRRTWTGWRRRCPGRRSGASAASSLAPSSPATPPSAHRPAQDPGASLPTQFTHAPSSHDIRLSDAVHPAARWPLVRWCRGAKEAFAKAPAADFAPPLPESSRAIGQHVLGWLTSAILLAAPELTAYYEEPWPTPEPCFSLHSLPDLQLLSSATGRRAFGLWLNHFERPPFLPKKTRSLLMRHSARKAGF